jgi:hypothetical protein
MGGSGIGAGGGIGLTPAGQTMPIAASHIPGGIGGGMNVPPLATGGPVNVTTVGT